MNKITKYIKELFRGERSFWEVFYWIFISIFLSFLISYADLNKILNIDNVTKLKIYIVFFSVNIVYLISYLYVLTKTKSKNKIQYCFKGVAVTLAIIIILFSIFCILFFLIVSLGLY